MLELIKSNGVALVEVSRNQFLRSMKRRLTSEKFYQISCSWIFNSVETLQLWQQMSSNIFNPALKLHKSHQPTIFYGENYSLRSFPTSTTHHQFVNHTRRKSRLIAGNGIWWCIKRFTSTSYHFQSIHARLSQINVARALVSGCRSNRSMWVTSFSLWACKSRWTLKGLPEISNNLSEAPDERKWDV